MDITQPFLTACSGKTFTDGRLEDANGNWWVARINGTYALARMAAVHRELVRDVVKGNRR